MTNEYAYYKFPSYGYLNKKFEPIDLEPLIIEIENIKNNINTLETANKKLAGQIDRQFTLSTSKSYIEQILLPFANEYDNIFNYFGSFSFFNEKPTLVLDDLWVNFQKKYEYNPVHDHAGVLSFVIWINVPYDIKNEIKSAPGSGSLFPKSGSFEFLYATNIGKISSEIIPVTKELELTAIIFPSTFLHQVYPFYTSDDYRISVSGNFKFKF